MSIVVSKEVIVKDKDLKGLLDRIIELKQENKSLKEAYVGLWETYTADVKKKAEENKKLKEENKRLEKENKILKAEIERLKKPHFSDRYLKKLEEENKKLKTVVEYRKKKAEANQEKANQIDKIMNLPGVMVDGKIDWSKVAFYYCI